MRHPSLFALAAILLFAPALAGQTEGEVLEAYYRAVGDHFGVSLQEVTILSEWRLAPDEVPVVLFLSGRSGISPDAIVALRRGGRTWAEVAGRYDMAAGDFHVPFADGAAAGSLATAYERFAATPAGSWSAIPLSDDDIVGLVNVRVLSEAAGVPPNRVVASRDGAGSYVAAFRSLMTGGR